MKIILSKKGIDSSFSSKAIPIFENNIVFLPIPEKNDKIKYSDIKKGALYRFAKRFCNNITIETTCHLDPQLENYFNTENFKGNFGQIKSFQTHLENQNVEIGDIFLFYGWYQDIINDNIHKNGKNVIMGYLQIGEIIKPSKLNDIERNELEQKYPWLIYHPHWNKEKYKDIPNNTIYIATDTCSFDNSIKGYGMFKYSPKLDLTSQELTNKTCWQVNELKNCTTSKKGANGYNNFNDLGQYRVSARCQEIVINDKNAEKWAIDLINKHSIKGR